jgi:low affinity Fe/Cu permease
MVYDISSNVVAELGKIIILFVFVAISIFVYAVSLLPGFTYLFF